VLIVALGLTLVAVVLLSAALVLGVYFYTQKLDRQEKHARLRRRGTAAGIFQWSTTNRWENK
jgi:hypothetical protein